jgi:adenylosuccinate synthase
MPLNIIIGAQWGDEGKGRVVDLLAGRQTTLPVLTAATMPVTP